ncbi:hypothetical protein BTO06_03985 [Tenacibaculum sp. SZ-18]|uniref:hypothetical protein n=1 Tax=Tenacibaculum sp. SZ-18 TaxID=754423 RepID=UPI000C2CF4EE|nr:hypothetical protein [Tenacibaculum sp. SZ-18]AUC14352.1 hypothetical protein BTO06_03985 [Tenacibaculum sp. SZ-18]
MRKLSNTIPKEELELIREADLAYENFKRKEAIKQLFIKSSFDFEFFDYNIYQRCFLWFKTFICLVLKRTNASYLDKNTFCILSYNESSDMCGMNWEACWVSTDLFCGWNVCVGSDGT